jgi:hypothetical protein
LCLNELLDEERQQHKAHHHHYNDWQNKDMSEVLIVEAVLWSNS